MPTPRSSHLGTSLFRLTTTTTTTNFTLSPLLPATTTKPFFISNLRIHPHRRRCSSSSSTAAIETLKAEQHQQKHPWPEWVAFVDKLKTKGYLTEEIDSSASNDSGVAAASVSVYTDMNQLKEPCLSFARDRFDVFKSLSIADIQTLVGSGCPTLFRKVVNSAKRLRDYVRLDEGEVCGSCNLRGSCDRAYLILKDSEVNPRTVDVVRVLLFYVLDPLVISGEEKLPGREHIEPVARKMLSQLIELSETTPDPAFPRSPAKVLKKDEQQSISHASKLSRLNLVEDELSKEVEMKRGDWMCPKCKFMNFARNMKCLKCNESGPKNAGGPENEMKKGDWLCPKCDFINFARNVRCLKCKGDGPKRVTNDVEMKEGDWNCPGCGFMNFASNKKCFRCKELRPKRLLNPGEWECPSCDFLNYRRNTVCLKCHCKRPEEAVTTDYEEQIWKSPH